MTPVKLGALAVAPTRHDRRRQRTRDGIIAAVQALIATDGSDFNMQAVADRADVALATVYNHFKNKQELQRSAYESALLMIDEYLSDRTRDIDDPLARIAMRLRLHARIARTHPQLARVLITQAALFPGRDVAVYSSSIDLVQALPFAAAKGWHRDELEMLALTLLGGNRQVLAMQLVDVSIGDDFSDGYVRVALRMLGLSPSRVERLLRIPLPV